MRSAFYHSKYFFFYFILVVFSLFISSSVSAQEEKTLFPFPKGGLWGYMNAEQEVVVEPQYTVASQFKEGYAFVMPKIVQVRPGTGHSNVFIHRKIIDYKGSIINRNDNLEDNSIKWQIPPLTHVSAPNSKEGSLSVNYESDIINIGKYTFKWRENSPGDFSYNCESDIKVDFTFLRLNKEVKTKNGKVYLLNDNTLIVNERLETIYEAKDFEKLGIYNTHYSVITFNSLQIMRNYSYHIELLDVYDKFRLYSWESNLLYRHERPYRCRVYEGRFLATYNEVTDENVIVDLIKLDTILNHNYPSKMSTRFIRSGDRLRPYNNSNLSTIPHSHIRFNNNWYTLNSNALYLTNDNFKAYTNNIIEMPVVVNDSLTYVYSGVYKELYDEKGDFLVRYNNHTEKSEAHYSGLNICTENLKTFKSNEKVGLKKVESEEVVIPANYDKILLESDRIIAIVYPKLAYIKPDQSIWWAEEGFRLNLED